MPLNLSPMPSYVNKFDSGQFADWCNSNQGVISFLGILVAVLAFTIPSILALQTIRQVGKNNHESNRPVMIANVRLDMISKASILVIKNYGTSPAYDVKITFPDGFGDGEPSPTNIPAALIAKYKREVPTWGPGEERLDYYQMIGYYQETGEIKPPDILEGEMTYWDIGRNTPYIEKFKLDLSHIVNDSMIVESFSERMLDETVTNRGFMRKISNGVDSMSKIQKAEYYRPKLSTAVTKIDDASSKSSKWMTHLFKVMGCRNSSSD